MKQNSRHYQVELATLAMLTAIACILVMLYLPYPLFPAFKYDLADVPIFIATFAFGPVAGLIVTVLASFIEAFIMGQDTWVGFVMHVLATGSFVIVAGLIYGHKKTKKEAIVALIFGVITMTVVMCAANYIIDPIFYGTPKEAVLKLMLPAIIPFNVTKAGINAVITFLVYKRISKLIHKAEAPKING